MQRFLVWKQLAAMEDPAGRVAALALAPPVPGSPAKSSGKAKLRSPAAREYFYIPPVWTARVRVGGHTQASGLPSPALRGQLRPLGQASGLAPQVVPATCGHSFMQPASPVHAEQPPGTSTQHFFPSLQHGMVVAAGASAVVGERLV